MRYLITIIGLCLLQVLVLNHIHLLGCATPMLIVYPLLFLPTDVPHWARLVIAFVLGLITDMFTNTPGMGAASLTATAMCQPRLLSLCVQREEEEAWSPSLKQLGTASYTLYATLIVSIFCLLYFSLENFGFFHWLHWMGSIVGSTLFTLTLIMAIETARKQ